MINIITGSIYDEVSKILISLNDYYKPIYFKDMDVEKWLQTISVLPLKTRLNKSVWVLVSNHTVANFSLHNTVHVIK